MGAEKEYYLIRGVDKLTGNIFIPSPCLFKTLKEADKYIELNDNKVTCYTRKRVTVGKMRID